MFLIHYTIYTLFLYYSKSSHILT